MRNNEITVPSKAAAYLRLSREDGDKMESDSIRTQRDMIQNYVREHSGIEIVDTYIDDGFTGTTYDRPAFQRMMQDVESQKINCIIVKDLSRFGRNYIETGRYLEKIFPVIGVRFIAITDHYDTYDEHYDTDKIIIPFKNLINDAYCRDISIKIRSAKESKRKNGQYIASFAPYGYKKDPNDINKLVIDEPAAEIVKMLFNWKLDGYGISIMTKMINEMKIDTPMQYKLKQNPNFRSGFRGGRNPKWDPIMIQRILRNEIYTGTMIQGRTEKINYKINRFRQTDPSEWARVEGTHEAIIPKDMFDLTQDVISRDSRTSPYEKKVFIFSGYIKCGDCGGPIKRKIAIKENGKKYFYYVCRNSGCSLHEISETKLIDAVTAAVKVQVSMVSDLASLINNGQLKGQIYPGLKPIELQIAEAEKEIRRYRDLVARLYIDYQEKNIELDEYTEMNQRFSQKTKEYETVLKDLNEKRQIILSSGNQFPWLERYIRYKDAQELDRRMVVSLIDCITVYDKDHIEIRFQHEDEIREIIEHLNMTDKGSLLS